LSNNYDNWCPEIYRGLFIDRFNSDQIKVAPCCAAKPAIENSADFSFESSPYLTKLREQFDRGERPVECHQCWDAEACGNKSRRLSATEFCPIPQHDNDQVVLEGIDYNCTWACNLSCVMCDPQWSSSWATDLNLPKNELLTMGRLYRNKNNVLENLNISQVRRVHFNGGEPLLNNDHTELLLQLEQAGVLKDTKISYNTNGTTMPTPVAVDLWSKANLVRLYFSIDAVGPAFEYIRQPGNWAQVSKNMLDMKESMSSNVAFGFNITVGSHNIFELDELNLWIQEKLATNKEGASTVVSWQIAYNFNPGNLTRQAKLDAIKYLTPLDSFNGLANYLTSTLDNTPDNSWINTLQEIDARRNTNWKQALKIGQYY
jgi:MoaA/NifB/PqqE/SkfB family radical SAM enzyme